MGYVRHVRHAAVATAKGLTSACDNDRGVYVMQRPIGDVAMRLRPDCGAAPDGRGAAVGVTG